MQACCDVTFKYVHERKQFDKRIGEFQLMQVSYHSCGFICEVRLHPLQCERKHFRVYIAVFNVQFYRKVDIHFMTAVTLLNMEKIMSVFLCQLENCLMDFHEI
jgi:hypothetical protein